MKIFNSSLIRVKSLKNESTEDENK